MSTAQYFENKLKEEVNYFFNQLKELIDQDYDFTKGFDKKYVLPFLMQQIDQYTASSNQFDGLIDLNIQVIKEFTNEKWRHLFRTQLFPIFYMKLEEYINMRSEKLKEQNPSRYVPYNF